MFGYVAMVLLILIPVDLVLLLVWSANRLIRKKPLIDPSRRSFVRESMGAAVLGVPAVANLNGLAQRATGPRLKVVEVPVKDLPPIWTGSGSRRSPTCTSRRRSYALMSNAWWPLQCRRSRI
jgi:hypothetical protein